ncbi:hypothetical protein DFP72DRAFT_111692 [Ephemerocybe angulata]|uniref:Uncharacterized protein n=1 Tax=Ephemerocybe angulata TaxID=980116 RepID=A0A8H6HCL1_9AGAR|nr:hypothetical protein DFP72DRAFT_111692 [Tulosesus angulatus]
MAKGQETTSPTRAPTLARNGYQRTTTTYKASHTEPNAPVFIQHSQHSAPHCVRNVIHALLAPVSDPLRSSEPPSDVRPRTKGSYRTLDPTLYPPSRRIPPMPCSFRSSCTRLPPRTISMASNAQQCELVCIWPETWAPSLLALLDASARVLVLHPPPLLPPIWAPAPLYLRPPPKSRAYLSYMALPQSTGPQETVLAESAESRYLKHSHQIFDEHDDTVCQQREIRPSQPEP